MSPPDPPTHMPAPLLETVFSALSGLVVQDRQGRITWVNQAGEALLGLTRAQLQGRDSLDPRWRAVDGDGQPLPGDQHPAMRTLRTGAPCDRSIMGIHTPDGRLRWLSVTSRLLTVDGGVEGVVSSFADVTAQREASEALAAQRDRLFAAQRLARIGDWRVNPSSRTLWLSPLLKALLNTPRDTLGVDEALGWLPSADADGIRRVARTLRPGDNAVCKARLTVQPPERTYDLLIHLERVADGTLRGVAQDVSEARSLQRQLAAAQDLQALAVDGARLGTWNLQIGSGHVEVNRHWCEMLGRPVTPTATLDEWRDRLHPEDREATLQALDDYISGRRPQLLYEYRLRRDDGRWATVFSDGQITERGADGAPLRMVGINLDVSPLHAAQRAAHHAHLALGAVPDGVALVDSAGHVISSNPAFAGSVTRDGDVVQARLGLSTERAAALEVALATDSVWTTTLTLGDSTTWQLRLDRPVTPGGPRALVLRDITQQEARERQAQHDPLTAIPNRRALRSEMDRLLAGDQPFAVVFLDLDAFKPVNDRWGHPAGDQVLATIAQRLRATVRPGDTVARFGGDEFVALLMGVQSHADAEGIVSRLVTACREPVRLTDDTVSVGASVGLALSPADGRDPDGLIHRADARMMAIKRQRPRPTRQTQPPFSAPAE